MKKIVKIVANPKSKLLFLTLLVLMLLLQPEIRIAEGDKPANPGKPKPEPQPLILKDVNIVTAEPDSGRLRVWGYNETNYDYENIWSAESVNYDYVAIGNVDNDDQTREIVGTTRSRATEGKGRSRRRGYKIFFDVYKEGIKGVWKRSESVWEDKTFWSNEIVIADVDEYPDNEVVMMTPHWLVVYKYYQEPEEAFKILVSKNSFVDEHPVQFYSLAVEDIDGDSDNEILVTANEEGVENKGYLLIYEDATLQNPVIIPVDVHMGHETLRGGNLDNAGYLEIVTTGYVKYGDLYQSYLLIWKYKMNEWTLIVKEPIRSLTSDYPWVHIDIGELNPDHSGEEIVLGNNEPDELILYHLDDNYKLNQIWWIPLGYYIVTISDVLIANADNDEQNEIIASGMGRIDSNWRSGRFYLEVFDNNGDSEWLRIGGENGETEVWHAAVG